MTGPGAHYVPALRFHWLTRFYDPLVRVTLKEERFTLYRAVKPG